ncbi:MAG: hypothetical protein SCM11_10465 [Bacillota bacterium]|nr:hypothetical protein [Bacillota bacterium]
MLQPGELQLHHVRQEISRQVAFPEELSNSIDEQAANSLLSEVTNCQTADELLSLIFSLNRKRLNDLFGAVLVISAAAGEEPFNRLLEIFQMRATLSLTQTAWAFYQRHYPNDRLGRVLSTLLRSLDDKEEKPPFLAELQEITIDNLLPRRLAERLGKSVAALSAARLPISEDMIPIARLREKYPLLASYTSLSALPNETMAADCMRSGLCGYMVRMAILPDTSFAAAFLTAWFQEAADQEIHQNGDLFIQALRISRRPSQISLLGRYLRDYRLSANWDTINRAILDLFGKPAMQNADIPIDLSETKKAIPNDPFAPKPDRKPVTSQISSPAPMPAPEPIKPVASAEKQETSHNSLLGWFRSRKKDKDATARPAQPDQVDPKPELKPAPPETAAPEKMETAGKDHEQLFAELQQTLLDGIRLPEMQEDQTDDVIWKQLDSESAIRFRQWAYMDELFRHSGNSERKMIFFRRYALKIRSVQRWDDNTLLVDMDGFYIADHNGEEDKLWYYDENTISLLAENRHGRPALNQPQQTMINSRDAMLQDTINNIVCLPLDAVNLLYAHDFVQRVYEDRKNRVS